MLSCRPTAKTLPKFHSVLLIQLLIKEQSYWPPTGDKYMHMDISRELERGEDQDVNVKSKLTRQVTNRFVGFS